MRDPSDVFPYGVGFITAGIGAVGITASQVQLTLNIVAASLGIILTVMTLWWRRSEHKRRVKEFKDYQARIERLENAQEEEDDRHQDRRD